MSRIDVHQHILPPDYVKWLRAADISQAGGRDLPDWSAASAIDLMDRYGIESAILSLSTPGVYVGDGHDAAAMARLTNESSAECVKDHPDRFGFFATVPLPEVGASIAEITYAYDELRADGVIVLANANGTYLGDPAFDAVMAELDSRSAVVFVHPHILPGPSVPGIPAFAADFLLDTTRAGYNLVLHEVPRRFPNLKIILAHAGGFLPYAAYRIGAALFAQTQRPLFDIIEDLSSFYFDTALSSSPAGLPSLLAFAKPGHVLYGTDWPFAPETATAAFTGMLDSYPDLDDRDRSALNSGNAKQLFPRFG